MRTLHAGSAMTAQEIAWTGQHGNEYNRRSPGNDEANYHFFKKALFKTGEIRSILELGAGQGANLRALRRLMPTALRTALELNAQALEMLRRTRAAEQVIEASVLEWLPIGRFDLVLSKGLLIHIHPDELHKAYNLIYLAAARWILIAEYYNPVPVSVPYRGRDDLLWKRDFVGEMLDCYADLRLLDYGFVYHRDAAPQDDLTWFLLSKEPR
jgi:spore coat polysaccharide biosynthesis protein SpsF